MTTLSLTLRLPVVLRLIDVVGGVSAGGLAHLTRHLVVVSHVACDEGAVVCSNTNTNTVTVPVIVLVLVALQSAVYDYVS